MNKSEYQSYAEAKYKSMITLLNEIENNEKYDQDCSVFIPLIIQNGVQSIEFYLKYIIISQQYTFEEYDYITNILLKSHNINKLADFLIEKYNEYRSDFNKLKECSEYKRDFNDPIPDDLLTANIEDVELITERCKLSQYLVEQLVK